MWHSSDHGKSSLFVTLRGGSGRDDWAGTAGWLIWPLVSFRRHVPEHRLTVLFDEVGYKTLALSTVLEHDLLRPRTPAA